ncbi:hypothetical protein GCM10027416_05250 [Okibacterium endophyticum]
MGNRGWLWGAFALVHALVAWLAVNADGLPQGDLILVYQPWAQQILDGGSVVGIDEPWVYPIVALLPMLLATVAGPALYAECWLLIVALLDAAAFAMLIGRGRSRPRLAAAWWWIAFIAALGPIAFTRIDSITVPLAVVALLLVARHPRAGTVLLTLAAWMKVWPAAVVAVLVVSSRRRWAVIAAGAATSIVVIVVALVQGSGLNVLSFVTAQTERGLQIESPVATPYMWLASSGVDGAFVYYDPDILTYQVTGPNIDVAIAAMTPVLAAAVATTLLIGLWAVRRGASFVCVFPSLTLALVVVLIAFNKVGSPQFTTWLIAPVVAGIVLRGRRFAAPAVIALVIAALTQLVYPYLYGWLLVENPAMVFVVSLRNLGWFVLLGWSIMDLWRGGSSARIRRLRPRGQHTPQHLREDTPPAAEE